jgi:type II secretory pathway component PulF
LVISTVVVPKFAALLADLGQTLPPATRVLLAGSAFLTRHGVLLLAAGLGAVWLFAAWVRQPAGRLRWHAGLLALPGIGAIRLTLASARIGRALGGALHAGMPLLPALDAAREAVGDRAVAQRLAAAGERVSQGQPLAAALEHTGALSPSALQLVAVGEASGALAIMADRAGELAAQEAERGLKTLVNLLEPALVVFFGGLVAFVAAALLQAVYSLRPSGM